MHHLEDKHKASVVWLDRDLSGTGVAHAFSAYLQLTKPRIALLIVISTAVGFCFGTGSHLSLKLLVATLLGTALLAAGSATLNQWFERDIDSRMERTKRRPIPAGIIAASHALCFGTVISIVGVADLWYFTNFGAAALGALTSAGYLFLYTPMKRKGPICTTIGAVPGAMPPLIGFAAARGGLSLEAWILFGILFFWQFPHFHAIAWMYREDYERGGIKMLAVVQPDGKAVGRQVIVSLLLLVPITLAPTFMRMAGKVYFVAALLLGLSFLYFGIYMYKERSYSRARHLLLASVLYIPLLFAFLVFDNPKFPIHLFP